jgi:hypothetical protein
MLAPLLLLALQPSALAGDELSLHAKLDRAVLVMELRLPMSQPVPESWPNQGYDPAGWAFPQALIDRARQGAQLQRLLWGGGGLGHPPVPEQPWVFGSSSACWWEAQERGSVRSLVFTDREGAQIYGVEHGWGSYSDLNPRYEELVAAITRSVGWDDERPRAVAPEALWLDQRAALTEDNPYLLVLTRDFLLAHGAAEVLGQVWGPTGSPERAAREAAATWPEDKTLCLPE